MIRLGKALEYSIFSNLPLHIFQPSNPVMKIVAHVHEVQNNYFMVDCETAAQLTSELLGRNDLIVTLSYRQRLLSFETRILTAEEIPTGIQVTANQLVLAKPGSGTIGTRRVTHRVSLLKISSPLKAIIEAKTEAGKLEFETELFADLSQCGIGLFVKRSQGLVLTGDKIDSIRIYLKNELIIETTGTVQRVDPNRRAGANQGSYFLAIRLTDNLSSNGRAVAENDRRQTGRAALLNQSAFIKFRHPIFSDGDMTAQIIDISTSGISVLGNSSRLPLVAGMILHNADLQLPFQPRHRLQFRILQVQQVEDDQESGYRLRGEMIGISQQLLKAINSLVQTSRNSEVVDATLDDYEKLWEFLFETGFIYGDKRKQLQENAKKLFDTYTKLLQPDVNIVKNVVFKSKGTIWGHLSAIRCFDNAWLIQHLNALKSFEAPSAAQDVVMAIADYFLDTKANQSVGSSFVSCYYRPNNLYPSMVFGEIKGHANDLRISDFEDLDFCLPEALCKELHAEPAFSSISCHEATDQELYELESILIASGRHRLIRIEGLSVEGLKTLAISKEYERLDLYRYRKVFVARCERTGKSVFAVCNYASPGINLSELTNSFRLSCSDVSAEVNFGLASAVSDIVLKSYARTEVPDAVLLLSRNQPLPYQFNRGKVYRYWFFDTSKCSLFKEGAAKVFANLREYIGKYRRENEERAVG